MPRGRGPVGLIGLRTRGEARGEAREAGVFKELGERLAGVLLGKGVFVKSCGDGGILSFDRERGVAIGLFLGVALEAVFVGLFFLVALEAVARVTGRGVRLHRPRLSRTSARFVRVSNSFVMPSYEACSSRTSLAKRPRSRSVSPGAAVTTSLNLLNADG